MPTNVLARHWPSGFFSGAWRQIREYNIRYKADRRIYSFSLAWASLKPRAEIVHAGRAVVRGAPSMISRGRTHAGLLTSPGIDLMRRPWCCYCGGVVYYFSRRDRPSVSDSLKRVKDDRPVRLHGATSVA